MQSRFEKKKTKFVANRIFTDRINPTKVFWDSIKSIENDPQEIIVYYGKGGIGKSRLLRTLCETSPSKYPEASPLRFTNIVLSFDAVEFNSEINIMLYLRSRLRGDGGLFDYALINYWAKTKLTVDEIRSKNSSLSPSVSRFLDEAAELNTGARPIPVFMAEDAKDMIRDEYLLNDFSDEIDEIESLEKEEILERLPFYLGLCFTAAAHKGSMHVFFFDAYEYIQERDSARNWLMDFLSSCEILRACIASRDRLRWEEEDSGWNDVLKQYLLSNLSEEDSRWFLSQVPITDEDTVSMIVKHSGGVPLFLDMSVDLYEADINNNKKPDFSKIQKGEKLMDRYFSYLEDKSRDAVIVLSVLDFFSLSFAKRILSENFLSFSDRSLKQLFDKSIIVCIDARQGIWKVDESVRTHLKGNFSSDRITVIIESILKCIKENGSGIVFPYFASVLSTVKENPAYMTGLNCRIIELIDYYGNSGYWKELSDLLAASVDSEDRNLSAVAVFAKTLFLRRSGNLRDEEAFIKAHPLDREVIGEYAFLYEYYYTQCRHLEGYYDDAIRKYDELVKRMNLIKNAVPAHIYVLVNMKYADLLFLKGKFDESLSITDSLLERNDIPVTDQIELMRIKGHIYRFQGRFDEAEFIYETALKTAKEKNLDAYVGKLVTNLTEANAFPRPEKAIALFEEAKTVNERCANTIELSKAYSACAIANANLIKEAPKGDEIRLNDEYYYAAVSCANNAISLARQAGYRSGEAFALIGLSLANKRSGRADEHREALEKIENLVSELNVYLYLPDFAR